MKKLITLSSVVLLIFSSCSNPDLFAPRPVEKSIILISEQQEPLPTNVELSVFFRDEQDLPDHNKIAHIQVVGDDWFSEEQLINNLKYEAHKLGANAIVNVEFGEQYFAVEKRRVLADTLFDNKDLRLRRKKALRQYMRGIAVARDSSALPQSNDSTASHIAYVKEERKNREQAEIKTNQNRLISFGVVCAGIVVAIIATPKDD